MSNEQRKKISAHSVTPFSFKTQEFQSNSNFNTQKRREQSADNGTSERGYSKCSEENE